MASVVYFPLTRNPTAARSPKRFKLMLPKRAKNPIANKKMPVGSGTTDTPPFVTFPLPARLSMAPDESKSTIFKPEVAVKMLCDAFPLISVFESPMLAPKGVTVSPVSSWFF